MKWLTVLCLLVGAAVSEKPIGLMEHIAEVNKESKGLAESDMKLAPFQENSRGAINGERYRWPSAVIPYVLDSSLDDTAVKAVTEAIDDYHLYTCIRLIPRTNEASYVNIIKDDGCWSYVGRIFSFAKQDLSLGIGCDHKMVAIHELMHAAGFYHTQSRYDRDEFVDIYWENIYPEYRYAFDMYDSSYITNMETYDLNSVMHYTTHHFSMNGQPTITRKGDPDANYFLGQDRETGGFTQRDINKLNQMYC